MTKLIIFLLKLLGYKYTIWKGDMEYYTSENLGNINPAAKLEISESGNVGIWNDKTNKDILFFGFYSRHNRNVIVDYFSVAFWFAYALFTDVLFNRGAFSINWNSNRFVGINKMTRLIVLILAIIIWFLFFNKQWKN